jgi:hypothetical protein
LAASPSPGGVPRYVYANWLGCVLDFDAPLDISLHLEHLARAPQSVSALTSPSTSSPTARIASAQREVACEEVVGATNWRGEQRVLSASLYLGLRATNVPALDELTRRVLAAPGGILASSRPRLFEMLPGLLSYLPTGQDHLGRCRNPENDSVATMIPFRSRHLWVERDIL